MKLTTVQYKKLIDQAEQFAAALRGDCAFSNPGVNLAALEAMLVGWMTTQPYFKSYVKECKRRKQDGSPFLLAMEQAAQRSVSQMLQNSCAGRHMAQCNAAGAWSGRRQLVAD